MRPQTLAEVAHRTRTEPSWLHHLNEFLDDFYLAVGDEGRQCAMIRDEPALLHIAHADAFLGGAGEHLARRWGLPIPAWVRHADRYLDAPLYVPGDPGVRPFLMIASPPSFRSRLIFTGPDPLQRARFPYARGTSDLPSSSWPADI